MKFIKDTREKDIITALLSGYSRVVIEGVEVFLNPLKVDTSWKRELEARKVASELIQIL